MAIHPLMDKYIRKTWSLLVEKGYDATYSTALNFLLLGAIYEAIEKEGWKDSTRRYVWNFINDENTITEFNLEDHLANLERQVSLISEEEETVVKTVKRKKFIKEDQP